MQEILNLFELLQNIPIVADEEQRGSVFAASLPNQRKHFPAVDVVEIAGGLIRQNELGPIGQRAGHGHPLLLAGRELPWAMLQVFSETDSPQQLLRELVVRVTRWRAAGRADSFSADIGGRPRNAA